jgi:cytochrome c oxidase subunit III
MLEPDRRAQQGVWLFLLSLAVFFVSSMILFVIFVALRLQRLGPEVTTYALPIDFVASTFLLIGVSLSLHYAVVAAKANATDPVLRLSLLAGVLALIFWCVQCHGMYWMLVRSLQVSIPGLSPFGFTFVLALLHALHVVGGMVALVSVIFNSQRRLYDHERHWGLRFCAIYWHFLDGVWIVMLVGFIAAIILIRRAAFVSA